MLRPLLPLHLPTPALGLLAALAVAGDLVVAAMPATADDGAPSDEAPPPDEDPAMIRTGEVLWAFTEPDPERIRVTVRNEGPTRVAARGHVEVTVYGGPVGVRVAQPGRQVVARDLDVDLEPGERLVFEAPVPPPVEGEGVVVRFFTADVELHGEGGGVWGGASFVAGDPGPARGVSDSPLGAVLLADGGDLDGGDPDGGDRGGGN